jgi:predicted DNA binding CopG/RHH family protein
MTIPKNAHFFNSLSTPDPNILKTISIRLPESMLEELKLLANKHDVPYQSLLKIFISERIQKELKAR